MKAKDFYNIEDLKSVRERLGDETVVLYGNSTIANLLHEIDFLNGQMDAMSNMIRTGDSRAKMHAAQWKLLQAAKEKAATERVPN